MNKTKKIAFAAVAVVMAGTLGLSMAACTPQGETPSGNDGDRPLLGNDVDLSTLDPLTSVDTSKHAANMRPNVTTNENGEVELTYAAGTELRINMGNQNSSHPASISFQPNELGATVTLPDGKEYNRGNLKPAWQALSDELDIKFTDVFQNRSGDNQITQANEQGEMANYDLISASAAAMTQNTGLLVNLTDYLDYMPNYKAFLDANPAIYYSLTSNTSNGAMYYAPYFDGFNDIEKYVLAEKTWINTLLNASDADLARATTTYAAQAASKTASNTELTLDGTRASVTSYMGTTGSYSVEATSADDDNTLGTATVNYDAALAAAQSSNGLGAAIQAAKGSAYSGASGNIVDIMNDVINSTNGNVNGGQLLKILQEYIDVAYTLDGEAYEDRADVFNSISACWDVDLLVALSRCAVTCGDLIGATTDAQKANIYGVSGRQGTTQRRVDLIAFVGELYGVRGLESRYEYTYVDATGHIRDARQNTESYDAMVAFSALAKEGLLYTGTVNVDANRDFSEGPSTLFMHDYSQTQTTTGFSSDTYNVAPILTPVSNWDTDDNGEKDTIMRFTESWRSVKNTGFCISLQGVQGNADRLSAALKFIDYLFSNDGQLLMTYGPMDTTGNSSNPDGWWYGNEADVDIDEVAEVVKAATVNQQNYIASTQYQIKDEYEGQYFIYKGTVYTSTVPYSRAVPIMTTANQNFFLGQSVNGFTLGTSPLDGMGCATNYTNYARWVVGTTLPLGNKDQGFEYQCTADCALEGAAIVSQALVNGAIKHVALNVTANQGTWYLIAPTAYALTTANQSTMTNTEQTLISGTYFLNSSSTNQRTNLYLDYMFYGYDTSKYIGGSQTAGNLRASAQATIDWLNDAGLQTRINILSVAWNRICSYYNIPQTQSSGS